jgi:hypothetical protein
LRHTPVPLTTCGLAGLAALLCPPPVNFHWTWKHEVSALLPAFIKLVVIAAQCSLFTGMIPVFAFFLITGKWYWEVVCESGMEHILILRIHSHFDSAPQI